MANRAASLDDQVHTIADLRDAANNKMTKMYRGKHDADQSKMNPWPDNDTDYFNEGSMDLITQGAYSLACDNDTDDGTDWEITRKRSIVIVYDRESWRESETLTLPLKFLVRKYGTSTASRFHRSDRRLTTVS